jgi:ABC-type multidrug transport system ATPase subunit
MKKDNKILKTLWSIKNGRVNSYSHYHAIENINLEIFSGDKIAIIGEASSGHTTLFRILCGLMLIDHGEFNVMGFEINKEKTFNDDWDILFPAEIYSKIGVALEKAALLSNVTVREGFELLFRFRYGDHNKKLIEGAKKVVQALADRFELQESLDKRPSELSVVDTRKAVLARAFLSKPQAVFLENPAENFGQLSYKKIEKILDSIFSDDDRTVVMTTENLLLAKKYCERWIVLEEGKISFNGLAEEFFSKDPTTVFQKTCKDLVDTQPNNYR